MAHCLCVCRGSSSWERRRLEVLSQPSTLCFLGLSMEQGCVTWLCFGGAAPCLHTHLFSEAVLLFRCRQAKASFLAYRYIYIYIYIFFFFFKKGLCFRTGLERNFNLPFIFTYKCIYDIYILMYYIIYRQNIQNIKMCIYVLYMFLYIVYLYLFIYITSSVQLLSHV